MATRFPILMYHRLESASCPVLDPVERPWAIPVTEFEMQMKRLSETHRAGVSMDQIHRALSAGTPALEAAAFVEGFLGGAGTLLVHDPVLLGLLDDWLSSLPGDAFVAALPLVRRTFGAFEAAERRTIGERIRRGDAGGRELDAVELDPERVAAGLETMAQLLGVSR